MRDRTPFGASACYLPKLVHEAFRSCQSRREAVCFQSEAVIAAQSNDAVVESRMGAVAWGQWPTPRFPSPLIEPDIPISGIRPLSDWLHRKAHDVTH
jgi:hypothetical protein